MRNEPSGLSWTLDDQREASAKRRFLAIPLAGTIAWAAIGAAGAFLSDIGAAWAVFIGTGSVFYLAVLIARFTGEDLLGKKGPKNFFNHLRFVAIPAVIVALYLVTIWVLESPKLETDVLRQDR